VEFTGTPRWTYNIIITSREIRYSYTALKIFWTFSLRGCSVNSSWSDCAVGYIAAAASTMYDAAARPVILFASSLIVPSPVL